MRMHRARGSGVAPLTPSLETLEGRTLFGASPLPQISDLENASNPVVRIETRYGDIDIELLADHAPLTVHNYIQTYLDTGSGTQMFFNRATSNVLEFGTYAYQGDEGNGAQHVSLFPGAPGEGLNSNTTRTISMWARHTPSPPFSQFVGAGMSFNLTDNAPPAPDGDWVVFARVVNDASWNVVQTITGLQRADFMNQDPIRSPWPEDLNSVPVTRSWSSGDPVTPDLLVQSFDVKLIKDKDAADFYRHTIYETDGYAGLGKNEYIPIENPTDQRVYYEIKARYEHIPGELLSSRDDLIQRGFIEPHSRGGVTVSLNNPSYHPRVLWNKPYAVEINSTGLLGATMSRYDFGNAAGEDFTSTVDSTWTFAQVEVGLSNHSFLSVFNPSMDTVTVTATLMSSDGTQLTPVQFTLGAHRRGGLDLSTIGAGAGMYAMRVTSSAPIMAELAHFGVASQPIPPYATLALGQTGVGSTTGIVPLVYTQGQLGSGTSRVTFFNGGATNAVVSVDFYEPGFSTPSRSIFDAVTLQPGHSFTFNFPDQPISGPAASMVFRSTTPVFAGSTLQRPEDGYSAPVATLAATEHYYGEGFTDPARTQQNVLEERIAIFNPHGSAFGTAAHDAAVTITFRYTDGTVVTHSTIVAAGSLAVIDVSLLDEVVHEANQNGRYFYSMQVTSDVSVVSQMLHCDSILLGTTTGLGGGFLIEGSLGGTIQRLDQLGP